MTPGKGKQQFGEEMGSNPSRIHPKIPVSRPGAPKGVKKRVLTAAFKPWVTTSTSCFEMPRDAPAEPTGRINSIETAEKKAKKKKKRQDRWG